MPPRRVAFLLRSAAVLVLVSAGASARTTRPRFEPTDLELQDPGMFELDLQAGPTLGRGSDGNRLILSDFEANLGLLPNVELDLDGSFRLDRFDSTARNFDGEALWPAVKLGLWDSRTDSGRRSLAFGVQLGPRLPTIGARGIGYAALGLLGWVRDRTHLVVNLGGIVDPGPQITRGQAESVVLGLDLDLDLDARNHWSLLGELAVAHYFSPDPDEFSATLGPSLSVCPSLDVSLIGLVGFLPGADRAAVLLGASPKFPFW